MTINSCKGRALRSAEPQGGVDHRDGLVGGLVQQGLSCRTARRDSQSLARSEVRRVAEDEDVRVGGAESSPCVVGIAEITCVVRHGHDEAFTGRRPCASERQCADSGENASHPGGPDDAHRQPGQSVEAVSHALDVPAAPGLIELIACAPGPEQFAAVRQPLVV